MLLPIFFWLCLVLTARGSDPMIAYEIEPTQPDYLLQEDIDLTLRISNRDSRPVEVPIPLPLADVVNAWMFTESAQDTELLAGRGGLFRNLKDDQIYQLYDSEAYRCGDLDESRSEEHTSELQ